MNEEIDLREYIEVIIRRWKWIVGLMVVSAFAAGVASLLLPPVYEAKAGVLIRRSREEVNFESMLRTLSEEALLPTGSTAATIEARRDTLVALASSSAVATLVSDELAESLGGEVNSPNALLAKVNVQVRGDLILIKVRNRDPKKAAAIANAWGEAYERYVNELYSERPQSAENIGAQAVEARKTYEEAQEALARFRGDNRIEILNGEIEDKQNTLADYYATKRQINRLIGNAKALREQWGEGGSVTGAANDLSILLLKASAFTLLAPDVSAQLQLSLEQGTGIDQTAEEQIGDLDTLIAVLEAKGEEVEALIDEMSLQREILGLQEQLEREEARKRELTQARDLAWETYQTLVRKEAEVEVSEQVMGMEVRFAVPAVEAGSPIAPKKEVNIAIGGVGGLMVGVIGAFGAEYLRRADEGKE